MTPDAKQQTDTASDLQLKTVEYSAPKEPKLTDNLVHILLDVQVMLFCSNISIKWDDIPVI